MVVESGQGLRLNRSGDLELEGGVAGERWWVLDKLGGGMSLFV